MNRHLVITMLIWAGVSSLAGPAYSAGAEAVMLEIVDGETAFLVDKDKNSAWWIVGECRVPLPMDDMSKPSKKKSINSMTSKVIKNDVRLGSRQITLRQQYRFDLASAPVRVDVFNSVRGGWSQVPVRVKETCMQDATCRRRAELPEC
jgi:hypothetical protein